ncbi:hypothetical protein [Saccharothrix luteola]|uniref:hypothetical protein n=1 Tax=Saccharothrix luteola TaxID=2893018 RepID=UPI001E653CFD|nr:hypothetical protein [Saccharothrix luteola]MCC8245008.1 hypothetical protein [Saccharothrix luteola]
MGSAVPVDPEAGRPGVRAVDAPVWGKHVNQITGRELRPARYCSRVPFDGVPQ